MCRADSDASDMSHFDFEDREDDNISVAWFGDEGKEVMHEHDSDHDLNHEFDHYSIRGDFVDEEKWEIARLKALSDIHANYSYRVCPEHMIPLEFYAYVQFYCIHAFREAPKC